jgi:hypothetical protein
MLAWRVTVIHVPVLVGPDPADVNDNGGKWSEYQLGLRDRLRDGFSGQALRPERI